MESAESRRSSGADTTGESSRRITVRRRPLARSRDAAARRTARRFATVTATITTNEPAVVRPWSTPARDHHLRGRSAECVLILVAPRAWPTFDDIAELFAGGPDLDWTVDRERIDQQLRTGLGDE